MKSLSFIFIIFIFASCGSKTQQEEVLDQDLNSNIFKTADIQSLPNCNKEKADFLYYVASEDVIYACDEDSGLWNPVNLGVSLASQYILQSSSTNHCTQYTSDQCYFKGGLLSFYSNGIVDITVSFLYAYEALNNTYEADPDYDVDTDQYSITVSIPSSKSFYLRLGFAVARGRGFGSLWAYYDHTDQSISIYADEDMNGYLDINIDEYIEEIEQVELE